MTKHRIRSNALREELNGGAVTITTGEMTVAFATEIVIAMQVVNLVNRSEMENCPDPFHILVANVLQEWSAKFREALALRGGPNGGPLSEAEVQARIDEALVVFGRKMKEVGKYHADKTDARAEQVAINEMLRETLDGDPQA